MDRNETLYAVFGAGHGSQYLDAAAHLGRGHLAYRGPSLTRARWMLAQMQDHIRRLREQPDLRHLSDTYRIYVARAGGSGWEVMRNDDERAGVRA